MGITLKNNKAIISNFKRLSRESKEIVQEELTVAIDTIYNESQRLAPADMGGGGGIRGSGYKDMGVLTGIVAYRNRYAAYQEFGTGAEVSKGFAKFYGSAPEGLPEYAMNFFVNGKGRLPANPFLFPAFFAETKRFVERLKGELVK